MDKPIGANAEVHFDNDPEDYTVNCYFSFGEYNEDTDSDSFGVPDCKIFFYVESEHDLKCYMVAGSEDFVIKSYTLEY